VLDYSHGAIHLGLTATPKEKRPAHGQATIAAPEYNLKCCGNPIYNFSLKQGIEDGLPAPYQVIRVVSDVDAMGYTPKRGKVDKDGEVVEQGQYNTKDFDRMMVLTQRIQREAARVWEYLKATDPMAKTIVFCDDQARAEPMRQALVNLIPEAAANRRYVVRITSDDKNGKALLAYFIDEALTELERQLYKEPA
jgi:type I restriction enzyme R subunit